MFEASIGTVKEAGDVHLLSPPELRRSDMMARVMIVDDEEADRLLMQAVLARSGYETVVAVSGEDALRQYLEAEVDVVVTDLQMQDVHGFELITILRDFNPAPQVVAVSATGPFQLHMAEALGARWTLRKPLDPELLLDAVKRALAAGPEDAREELA